MSITYSDQEIALLVEERKPLPADWRKQTTLRPKRGHRERHLDVTGEAENEFRIILRQNSVNMLDFSIILAVRVPKSSLLFRLCRYNGKSHQHTNHLEKVTFHDFHIHSATERYQEFGTREDAYAEPTGCYGDFDSALRCLMEDANVRVPHESQQDLFREG